MNAHDSLDKPVSALIFRRYNMVMSILGIEVRPK